MVSTIEDIEVAEHAPAETEAAEETEAPAETARGKRDSARFRIVRRGQFTVTLGADSPCYARGGQVFGYRISVESRRLDERGFIMDSFAIPNVFERYGRGVWSGPCEALAIDAVRDLIDANRQLSAVEVEIKTPNGTEVSVSWERGQLKPRRRMVWVESESSDDENERRPC